MPAPAAVRGSGTSECRGWYFRAQGLVLPACNTVSVCDTFFFMFSLEFSETNPFMRLPGFSTLLLELPPLLELPSRWGGRRRASTSLAGASTSPAGASTSPLPVFGVHPDTLGEYFTSAY